MSLPKKTIVYIDGFNLYYGALNQKKPGFKWLNLEDWLIKLLPKSNYDIQRIKFFTARISATQKDPNKAVRQDIYLRALRTTSKVEIIEGFFLFNWKKIDISDSIRIQARVPEEKGTDVNIGAIAVNDGYKGMYDTAVIVSNDSDLSKVVEIIKTDLNLEVGIINPCITGSFSKQLTQFSNFKKKAREGSITSSQFPTSLSDSIGTFTKPVEW